MRRSYLRSLRDEQALIPIRITIARGDQNQPAEFRFHLLDELSRNLSGVNIRILREEVDSAIPHSTRPIFNSHSLTMVFSSRQLRHSSPQTGDDFSTDTPFRLYDINHRSVTGARSPTVPTSTSIDTQPHRAVAILGAGNGVNGLPVQAAGPGTTDLIASAMSRTSLDDGEVPMGLLYGDESSLSSSMERERPLNPDLPNKNALFVFANFASYMRAPNEGSEDVKDAQLRHVQRLLEHARVSVAPSSVAK